MSDHEHDDIRGMINDSEMMMADALAAEFKAIAGGAGESAVIDYVAIARYLDEDNNLCIQLTTRSDSHLVDTLGMLEFGALQIRTKLEQRLKGEG